MTLSSLLNSIGQIGINDYLVNWAGGGPSIYQAANALTIKDYPFMFISPTGTHAVEENWTRYSLTIFYVSRLLEDNSNEVDIQSTAIEVLKNIVRKIERIDGVVGVSDEYTINVFVEYEKFLDRCTGAYCQLEVSVLNDTICVAEDETHYFIFTTPDYVTIRNTATAYTIAWETDYPEINYYVEFYNGEIQGFTTTGDTATITFPENETKQDREFTIIARTPGVFSELGRRHFTQRAIDYFDFVTNDNVTISANSTAYTMEWATNYEGERTYTVTRNGNFHSSGITSGDRATVTFDRNDYRDIHNTFEITVSVNGVERGTLHWTQDYPAFTILTGKYEMFTAETTAATTTWEATYDILYYELNEYTGGTTEIIASGWTNGTALTLTLPVNYDSENVKLYVLQFRNKYEEPLDICEWRKEKFIPYFNFLVPAQSHTEIGSGATAITVEWTTNCPIAEYSFMKGENRVSGGTYGPGTNSMTLDFTPNETTDYILWSIVFATHGYDTWGPNAYRNFAQRGAWPYFNLLTPTQNSVSSYTTAFTINYETNIGQIEWAITNGSGYTDSGVATQQSGFTVTFPANTNTASTAEYTVTITADTAVTAVGIAQAEAEPIPDTGDTFTFLNEPGETFNAETTANTVEWNTNYRAIDYKFYSGNILVTSGNTSNTAVTVTFPANADTGISKQYSFEASNQGNWLDTLAWYQDPASGGTPDTGTTTDYLILTITENTGNATITLSGGTDLEYNPNAFAPYTWTPIQSGVPIEIPSWHSGPIFFRGRKGSDNNVARFITSGIKFTIGGDIYSMIQGSYDYQTKTINRARLYGMFSGCTGLTEIQTNLEAETFTLNSTYAYMFEGCTNLGRADSINLSGATSLVGYDFMGMFKDCTSLLSPPSLPDSALSMSCCARMFMGCTSLTSSPSLRPTDATGIVGCYELMFRGCSSLNEVRCRLDPETGTGSVFMWLSGVAPTGTLHVRQGTNWTQGPFGTGVPAGWTVVADLT